MAEVSANSPVYEQVGNNSSLRPEKIYQQKPKSPTPSQRKVDYCGVSDKVGEKHKNFKRRDTPRNLNLATSKQEYKPDIDSSFQEEEENSD